MTGWTWNTGRLLQRPVDLDYRTTKVYDAGTGGLSTGYHYDTVGNLDQIWDGTQTTQQATYGYDRMDRIATTQYFGSSTFENYGYDATGNRISFTDNNGSQTYTYPATSHRLTSIGSSLRGYDAAGNTTSIDALSKQYVYDGAGRLKQTKQGTSVLMNYRYNGRGERTRQFSGDAATTSVYTVYDEEGHWLGDYDANGVAKQQAIWFGDLPAGLLVGTGSSQQLDYVEADHLGTPRVVVDPDRDVAVWKWDAKSETFGNTSPNEDPDNDNVNFVFDLRFPGQRYDQVSGFNYNYRRDYDSGGGRYVESDPIGLMGGTATYAYAASNPNQFIDPYGTSVTCTDGVCEGTCHSILECGADYIYADSIYLGRLIKNAASRNKNDESTPSDSNVIPFPAAKQKSDSSSCPSDNGCELEQKNLLKRYLSLAALSALMPLPQLRSAALILNAEIVAHNARCPGHIVPIFPFPGPMKL